MYIYDQYINSGKTLGHEKFSPFLSPSTVHVHELLNKQTNKETKKQKHVTIILKDRTGHKKA